MQQTRKTPKCSVQFTKKLSLPFNSVYNATVTVPEEKMSFNDKHHLKPHNFLYKRSLTFD